MKLFRNSSKKFCFKLWFWCTRFKAKTLPEIRIFSYSKVYLTWSCSLGGFGPKYKQVWMTWMTHTRTRCFWLFGGLYKVHTKKNLTHKGIFLFNDFWCRLFWCCFACNTGMMIERFRKRCCYRFAEKKQTNKSKKTMERKEKKK